MFVELHVLWGIGGFCIGSSLVTGGFVVVSFIDWKRRKS